MKYNISLLAIFKNEESFLPEWLNHYLNSGIDHIYLLNDNSTDSSIDVINSSDYRSYISLKNVSPQDSVYDKYWRQEYLYNRYFSDCLPTTNWLAVFDLDEFCYSPQTKNLKNIVLQYTNLDIQQLLVEWYWFGSNGYIDQPKNIISSFTKRSKDLSKIVVKNKGIKHMGYNTNWCCKSFAKTKYISSIRHHYNRFTYYNKFDYVCEGSKPEFSINLSDEREMYINHYIGSYNYYFCNKVPRGSCNNDKTILRNKAMLYDYINLNEVEDYRLSSMYK